MVRVAAGVEVGAAVLLSEGVGVATTVFAPAGVGVLVALATVVGFGVGLFFTLIHRIVTFDPRRIF